MSHIPPQLPTEAVFSPDSWSICKCSCQGLCTFLGVTQKQAPERSLQWRAPQFKDDFRGVGSSADIPAVQSWLFQAAQLPVSCCFPGQCSLVLWNCILLVLVRESFYCLQPRIPTSTNTPTICYTCISHKNSYFKDYLSTERLRKYRWNKKQLTLSPIESFCKKKKIKNKKQLKTISGAYSPRLFSWAYEYILFFFSFYKKCYYTVNNMLVICLLLCLTL